MQVSEVHDKVLGRHTGPEPGALRNTEGNQLTGKLTVILRGNAF